MYKYTSHTAIYEKLLQLIPDLPERIKAGNYDGCSKLDSPGMMDLHYDYVGKDDAGHLIIALSHYFKQNGDMVPDPDMEIRLIPERRFAEALTFQNKFVYQRVYEEHEGKKYLRPKLKEDLNEFLHQWLTNALEQGHRIELSIRKREQEATKKIPDEKSIPEKKKTRRTIPREKGNANDHSLER